MKIAIFGARIDGHIVRVSNALSELGVKVVLLDPEHDRSCAIRVGAAECETQFLGVDPLTNEQASTANAAFYWLRNKKRFTHTLTKEEQQSHFTILEMSAAVMADVKINGRRTHNNYDRVMFHENKGYQLSLARRVGLTIPETLISNDAPSVYDFAARARGGRLAIKALANVHVPPPFSDPEDELFIYTQLVSSEELLSADVSEFNGPPFIIQEYIEKAFEVRLVMFDGEALSYAIDSQSVPSAKVDWRLAEEDPPSNLIDTPAPIQAQCAAYLKEAGLNYGAFDFCVRPDGSWVFLECNSEGQWAWLESEEREITRLFARRFQALALA